MELLASASDVDRVILGRNDSGWRTIGDGGYYRTIRSKLWRCYRLGEYGGNSQCDQAQNNEGIIHGLLLLRLAMLACAA